MTVHLAIMKKSWGLLPKIIDGSKTIESRWSIHKPPFWDKVRVGDIVYFKNSGEPVTVRTVCSDVKKIHPLTGEDSVKSVLEEFAIQDGIGVEEMLKYQVLFAHKQYCMLIYIKDPTEIEPFNINKKGFALQAAWLTAQSVEEFKNGKAKLVESMETWT
jgi:ASC-1-like (ASCH) protein